MRYITLILIFVVALSLPGYLAAVIEDKILPTSQDPFSRQLHRKTAFLAFQAMGGIPLLSEWPVRAAGILNELSTALIGTTEPFFSENRFDLCDMAANEQGIRDAGGIAFCPDCCNNATP